MAGVFAFATGSTVITNGLITNRMIDDPGLNPIAVPALGGPWLVLLAVLLWAMGTSTGRGLIPRRR